ncbi:MAG TPA: rhomboid family intramembrane serine protease [Xanthomonadaceae bacterium]|nr:rhomboid family intramembrane serine protease [Xanthomonadaceae bacterium]
MFTDLPPVTRALLIANALMFLLQQVMPGLVYAFALWPLGEHPIGYGETVSFLPWQIVSYAFLHGNFAHLFFNMFALLMFGAPVEMTWGPRRFAHYYFLCVIGAGFVQLIVTTLAVREGMLYPTVGASGGVYGVLLAFGLMFPDRRVMLLFPPIPMKAITLVFVFGAIELFLGVTGTQQGVAHFAHLGGMAFGFLLIQYWRGRPPFRRRPDRRL